MTKNKFYQPFKWAGGKVKEMAKIRSIIGNTSLRICEPFLGSGVVTLFLGAKGSYGNELNQDIIDLFRHVDHPDFLKKGEEIMTMDNAKSKEFFYQIREEFNEIEERSPYRSALFLFLQCNAHFGLYRINPKGKYTSTWHFFTRHPQFKERVKSLRELNSKFKVLENLDYRKFISKYSKEISDGVDLAFIDPPYLNASHKDYSVGKGAFTEDDYRFLDDWAGHLSKKGVQSIICNYSTPNDSDIYRHNDGIIKFNSSRSMRLDNFIKRESIYVLYGFGNSLL